MIVTLLDTIYIRVVNNELYFFLFYFNFIFILILVFLFSLFLYLSKEYDVMCNSHISHKGMTYVIVTDYTII